MGSRGVLVGIMIAGIAVMMILSSIPAFADHDEGHDGKCPGTWMSLDAPGHPDDANGNDVVCFKVKGGKLSFRDDVLHPNNP